MSFLLGLLFFLSSMWLIALFISPKKFVLGDKKTRLRGVLQLIVVFLVLVFISVLINPQTEVANNVASNQNSSTSDKVEKKVKKNPEDYITIKKSRWSDAYGMGLAKWRITVANTSERDIKDIQFATTYTSPSGTVLDSGKETSYEIFPAGKTKMKSFTIAMQKKPQLPFIKLYGVRKKAKQIWTGKDSKWVGITGMHSGE